MTILNPTQCRQAFSDRRQLLEILATPDLEKPLSPEQIKWVSLHDHLLYGRFNDWEQLEKTRASMPSPHEGHLFIEAVVSPLPTVLGRLLLDCDFNAEREFVFERMSHPWSLWTWIASILMDDGVVPKDIALSGWTTVLPIALASKMDFEKSVNLPSSCFMSRAEWLESVSPELFAESVHMASILSLARNTALAPCNSASRRI